MVKVMNYRNNKAIMDKLEAAPLYHKIELTDLRLIDDTEDQKIHITYVVDKETNGVRREASKVKSKNTVVARNRKSIGVDLDGNLIFNEWLIGLDVLKENYGEGVYACLSHRFQGYSKIKNIRAIQINREIVAIFEREEAVDKDGLHLALDDGEMTAREGDYLTDAGYAIAATNMDQEYELVPESLEKPRTARSKEKEPPNQKERASGVIDLSHKTRFSDFISQSNSPIMASRKRHSLSNDASSSDAAPLPHDEPFSQNSG